ncbi:MAG: EAL domain-containing protein [Ilumatobacteraceae bacterium]|nr:EAL domain-containing protein [Ilumatobacteraceae bacterium]
MAHADVTDGEPTGPDRFEQTSRSMQELNGPEPLLLLVDEQDRVLEASEPMQRMTGLRTGDSIVLDPAAYLDPVEGEALVSAYQRVSTTPGARELVTVRLADEDGLRHTLELSIANLFDDPSVGAISVTGADVSNVSAQLIVSRLRDRLLDLLPAVVTVADDVGTIVYCSPRSEATLGRTPAEIVGRAISEAHLLPIEAATIEAIRVAAQTSGRWEGDVELQHKDGRMVPVQLILERIHDEEIGFRGTIGISFDIADRRKLEEDLAFQAGHDSLTGLYNRQRFVPLFEHALTGAERSGSRIGVVFIDLDDFKSVNDRIGHAGGDALLAAVGVRLRTVMSTECVAARFGGDEFVVYCPDIDDEDSGIAFAQRLLNALAQPIDLGAETVMVSASAGVALSSPGVLAEELLRRSDLAMYAAKDVGKNRIEVFDNEVGRRKRHRRAMIDELVRALDDDELTVHFQPEVSLHDGKVTFFEALTRWNHPQRGLIPPSGFVPMAEESGLIHRLGHMVLDESCRAMRSWLDLGLGDGLTVAVNISTRQLLDHDFPDAVDRLAKKWEVPTRHLCLEITETALIDADVASQALNRLDAIGVAIAIDDFGTGYSSLSRISQFPLDYLKIDRSFVASLATEPASSVIVQMVIDLAHALGIQTTAEGIETTEQLEHLMAAGCDIGQGFLWSPAVPFAEATAMLSDPPFTGRCQIGGMGSCRGVSVDSDSWRPPVGFPVSDRACRARH